MYEYFSLNKSKFLFQILSGVFLFAILYTILILSSQEINNNSIDLDHLFLFISLPILVQILLIAHEIIIFIKTNKELSIPPFDQLSSLGFVKTHSNHKSRWLSSMPILKGKIDNYPLHIEIEKKNVRVIAETNLDLVEKSHITELKTLFGKNNIEYDVGIALIYRSSRRKHLTSQELITELNQFIRYLKSNKLDAYKDNDK